MASVVRDSETGHMKVMVLADDLSEEGGVRSRILDEISEIREHCNVFMVSKVTARNLSRIHSTRTGLQLLFPKMRVYLIPTIPHGNVPVLKELFTIANISLLSLVALGQCLKSGPSNIYAHNMDCGSVALIVGLLLKRTVTLDLHGDEVEETIVSSAWKHDGIRSRFWRAWLGVLVRFAPRLVCVSNHQKDHFRSEYGRNANVFVIPCCIHGSSRTADFDRREVLREIGIERPEDWILFYSGSAGKHQMIDRIAEFREAILRDGCGCSVLLLISETRAIGEVARLFRPSEKSAVRVVSVGHGVVPRYASVSDVGFLFRQDALFNNISSPTKFAEYLYSGLPVIITPNVGDYSDVVSTSKLGKIVDLSRISEPGYAVTIMHEILNDYGIKERCREYASESLTWEKYASELMRAITPEYSRSSEPE